MIKPRFRAWFGGEPPIVDPSVRVDVILKDGTIVRSLLSEYIDWGNSYGITAWRTSK